MRKKIIPIFAIGLLTTFAFGFMTSHTFVEAGSKIPFNTHEIKDKDGCGYIVIYDRYPGKGTTVAVAQKVKQPAKCK